MNRQLPAPYRDIALLLARVLLGVIMFAHGYQKMMINGIGRTTEGFENLSIPLAIVSASFVTVVEFAGSVLIILGAMTPVVAGLNLVIMGGAAVFVHAKNGIFIADGGWELIGAIGAGFLALAALGAGRYSLDHLIAARQRQHHRDMELATGRVPVARADERAGERIMDAAPAQRRPSAARESDAQQPAGATRWA